jgi:hypothetical protein
MWSGCRTYYQDLNDDRVRGFSNILATLGDHDGGSGFNEPLLRAVASYVSKVGGQEAIEQKDWLFDYLRQSVDEANQSSHSADEKSQLLTGLAFFVRGCFAVCGWFALCLLWSGTGSARLGDDRVFIIGGQRV